jgi:tRNA threonylcarbamoyladenosine biosynthesis protein TsaB
LIVLGIETSPRQGSVALLADGSLRAFCELAPDAAGGGAGRTLAPTIDDLLQRHGYEPASLDLIAVGLGPVATARALGYALAKPVVGIVSPAALAAGANVPNGRVVVALDAKHDDLFVVEYLRDDEGIREVAAPSVLRAADVADRLDAATFVAGDGLPRIVAHRPDARGDASLAPRADVVAKLGLARFARGERDDPERLLPLYLRISEAERKFLARRGI